MSVPSVQPTAKRSATPTPLRLSTLAELVGGRLSGDRELEICDAATLRDAVPGCITFIDDAKFAAQLADSTVTAVLVSEEIQSNVETGSIACITVDNVRDAFATIVAKFRPQRSALNIGISPAAHIDPTATIGADSNVFPGCVVSADVTIGRGCTIHPGVVLMPGCQLGDNVTIFPNAVLYEGTQVGDRCIIHAGAVLGAYGFGYDSSQGTHELSPQLGNVVLEDDVEIGACTTIDRGTYGPTTIGEGTKIDNQVMVGHNCRLGKHNLLCAHVGIAGSCTTGDYVVMAGKVGLRDHVDIGSKVMIGAGAGVAESLPNAGEYLGAPAVPIRDEIQTLLSRRKLPEMRRTLRRLEKQVAGLESQQADETADVKMKRSDAA